MARRDASRIFGSRSSSRCRAIHRTQRWAAIGKRKPLFLINQYTDTLVSIHRKTINHRLGSHGSYALQMPCTVIALAPTKNVRFERDPSDRQRELVSLFQKILFYPGKRLVVSSVPTITSGIWKSKRENYSTCWMHVHEMAIRLLMMHWSYLRNKHCWMTVSHPLSASFGTYDTEERCVSLYRRR